MSKEEVIGFENSIVGSIQYGTKERDSMILIKEKKKGDLGSIGAIFNIISSVLGGGILSFPYAFAAAGAIGGFFTTILLSIFAYFALIIIIMTYER